METTLKGLHFYSPYGRVGVQVKYDSEEQLQTSFSISHNDIDYSNFATGRLEYGGDLYLKTSLTAMENTYYVEVQGEQVCITGKTSDFCDEIDSLFSYSSISNAGGLTLDSADCEMAFAYCTNLTVAPVITKDVTSLKGAFEGCSNLKYVDISALDSSTLANVDLTDMCRDCYPDGWLKVAPDVTDSQLIALANEIPNDWIIFGYERHVVKVINAHPHQTWMDGTIEVYFANTTLDWEIATDDEFEDVIASGSGTTSTSIPFEVQGLTNNTSYYVRARLVEDDGYGEWVTKMATTRYNYFTITNPDATDDLTITLTRTGLTVISMEVSDDNETWTAWRETNNIRTYTLSPGETVYMRGGYYGKANINEYHRFGFDGDATFGGSLTALLRSDWNDNDLVSYQFYRLFYGCTSLTTAPTLYSNGGHGRNCYYSTFEGCTGLLHSPEWANLETVPTYSFTNTFKGCTGLKKTIDMSHCKTINGFGGTYENCTGIDTPPDLSNVTNIGTSGLADCFSGCTGLTSVPDLSNVTTMGSFALASCFYGCTSLTTGVDLRNITTVYIRFAMNCYYGCTALTTVYTPNIDTWDTDLFLDWLVGVAASGTIYKPAALTIPEGASGLPSGWVTEDY